MLRHLVCCLVALSGTVLGADPPSALLVVGGGQSSVELVDLTDGGAESCISPVSAPNYLANAAGIWVDDKPTVCGGGNNYDYITSDKCFSYDMVEGKWIPYGRLPETRMSARSVQTSTDGWWITGGQLYPYDYLPQSSTLKISNGQFVTGETLPIGVAGHCLASMDDNHMILVGGYRSDYYSYDSWIYTVDQNKWDIGPTSNSYYNYISGICGVVKTNDDNKVVVGSGYNDYTGVIEIYSQNDNSFQNGPPLPKPLEGAASVQYGDSFIVVGGYDYNCYCDNSEILYLNPNGANGWTWDVMSVSLSSPRSHHVVFPLETVSGAICYPDIPTVPPAIIPDDSPAAILIIGGQNNKTEVIDLATGGAESCVSDLLAPHYSENAMGIFVGDKPTICGGWNWLGNPPAGYVDCWSLDLATGAWEQFTNMPEIRGQSSAAYTKNGGWFMAGGYDGTKIYPETTDLQTTVKLVNDESFEKGEVLPFTSKSHCMVGLDDNTYILAGGERGDYSKNACLYDVATTKWTCNGNFQFDYVFPVCGMYKKDGETRVLVGTGMSDNNYGYTEIYHLKNQSVTVGPLMPFGPLHAAYAYPFGETFVVAGGSKPKEGGAESTDILYFDPLTEKFQAMEQKMSIGRSNHLIFALDEFPSAVCSVLAASGAPVTDPPAGTGEPTTTKVPTTTSGNNGGEDTTPSSGAGSIVGSVVLFAFTIFIAHM